MNIAYTIRTGALCLSVSLASSQLVRSGQSQPPSQSSEKEQTGSQAGSSGKGQSQPPEKEQAGSQAGSSGKASEQMGAQGSKDSGLRKCDSDTTKTDTTKTAKKKKSKKPAPTKSS